MSPLIYAEELYTPFADDHVTICSYLSQLAGECLSSRVLSPNGKSCNLQKAYAFFKDNVIFERFDKEGKIAAFIVSNKRPIKTYYIVFTHKRVSIWYNAFSKISNEVNDILNHCSSFLEDEDKRFNLNVGVLTFSGHYTTKYVDMYGNPGWERPSKEEISILYGDSFEDLVSIIEESKGLTILSGPPGSGKTSLIRRAITEFTFRNYSEHENTDSGCIIMTPESVKRLNDPDLASYFVGQSGKRNFLIAEDAENVLRPRGQQGSETTSTLLNMTDGIIGEMFQAGLLATLNCQIDQIDSALLRPGRCVLNWYLGPLIPERAYALWELKHNTEPDKYVEPVRLANKVVLADLYDMMSR